MLLNEIKELLKTAGKYFSKDDELLKNIVLEDTIKMDKDLIKLLISNEKSKTHFFLKIEDVFVFDKDKFIKFIENKEFLPNSYTSYKNKIGLTDSKGEFIKEKNDVVLSWAYKDCYLEGGQDKEDMKKDEIFYNEILAPDEIDMLLEPKVLTNFRKYDIDGEHKVEDITMEDNLIIKGNNLLALHSLKEKYAGKIKLIYIDPPYNTGSDSFKYNDRFNHSTWLTFMKNRLEVARELLSKDGAIFIHCDYNQDAYLRVVLDEIFGLDNFIADIAVKSSTPSGTKTAHKDKKIIKQKDTILFYKKNNLIINPQYIPRDNWDTHYSGYLEIKNGEYIQRKLFDVMKEHGFEFKKLDEINPQNEQVRKFMVEHRKNIYRLQSHKNIEVDKISRTEFKDKIYEDIENNEIKGLYYNGQVLTFIEQGLKKVLVGKSIKEYWSMLLCDFWSDIDFQNTQNEGSVSLTNGKKPEALIKRIIDMITNENEIVLDYHLGSGTTCAVAHKMKRKYIGIEQMDYIEELAVTRLKNVINGENSGISKPINWQGGGSFIYCELMKWNENFIEKINNSENTEDLLKVYSQIKEKAFLNYKFDIEKFDNPDFKELKIEEQKEIIKKSLDLNSLYVNLSEIEDETYNISEEDKKLNKLFYKN